MATPEHYNLIITYTDGTQDHFRFPHQVEQASMASFIEKMFSSPILPMQMEDRLMVISTAGIRSAELFPVPQRLPAVVLHNVTRVHS